MVKHTAYLLEELRNLLVCLKEFLSRYAIPVIVLNYIFEALLYSQDPRVEADEIGAKNNI